MDRLLQEMINQAVEKQLARILGGSGSIDSIRRAPSTLDRLERRLDTLAAKLSGRRPIRKAGTARPGRPPIHTTCTRSGCRGSHYAKGLCSKHYQPRRRPSALRKARRKKG